jgi:hypothetical protein
MSKPTVRLCVNRVTAKKLGKKRQLVMVGGSRRAFPPGTRRERVCMICGAMLPFFRSLKPERFDQLMTLMFAQLAVHMH